MLYFYYINKNVSLNIFIASFIVFIFLNIIENYLHYNTGRHYDKEGIHFSVPSKKDWIKIISIMILFAILQAVFTMVLSKFI